MADKSWDDQYISKTDAIKLAIISVVPHTNPFNIYDFQRSFEKTIGDYTPSADVVEVVRCKDCKHSDTYLNSDESTVITMPFKCLGIRYGGVYPDWFCEHGERKDGGT